MDRVCSRHWVGDVGARARVYEQPHRLYLSVVGGGAQRRPANATVRVEERRVRVGSSLRGGGSGTYIYVCACVCVCVCMYIYIHIYI